MAPQTPFQRLRDELDAAVVREIASAKTAARPRRRRWRGRTFAVAVLLAAIGAVAAAWAASSLLSSGSPVPFARGAPVAGRAEGAPIPGTVKLLASNVADPHGGVPWGLRYWETDRKYGCLQVGRVEAGQLGQITAGKVFHELRLGVAQDALGGCFTLDGSGHAFAAIHTDAKNSAQLPACPAGVEIGTEIRGPHGRLTRCATPDVTIDFGLLGPHAKRFTYRSAGKDRTVSPLGAVGAYLVVQPHINPVMRDGGFHHPDPRLNFSVTAEPYLALTPASQVIKRVVYADGTCHVYVTTSRLGACDALAGFVPIPQPKVAAVRAPVHAIAIPDGRGIGVRFRARQAVIDGRSAYDIEVRPDHGNGFSTQDYSRNVPAGTLVRTTVPLYDQRRGGYRIVVRYRTVPPRPGPFAGLAYPGLLVGQTHVNVP